MVSFAAACSISSSGRKENGSMRDRKCFAWPVLIIEPRDSSKMCLLKF